MRKKVRDYLQIADATAAGALTVDTITACAPFLAACE